MQVMGAEHQVEQGGVPGTEVDVDPTELGQWGASCSAQLGGKHHEALGRDRGEETGAVAEMVLGGRVRDACTACDRSEADGRSSVLVQLGARSVEQSRACSLRFGVQATTLSAENATTESI